MTKYTYNEICAMIYLVVLLPLGLTIACTAMSNTLWPPLHTAVEERDLELVFRLILSEFNTNQRDVYGRLPIEIAMDNNDGGMVNFLILHGTIVNQTNSKGKLLIEAAMEMKNDEDIYSALKHLVLAGASLMDVPKEKRNTPAWQRAYQEDGTYIS